MVKVNASMARDLRDPRLGHSYKMRLIYVEPSDRFNFECQRCGICCTWPPGINPNELARMSEFLGISRDEFFNKYTETVKHPEYGLKVKIVKKGGHCVFLKREDGKASCSIYEAKPAQCRGLPLFAYADVSGDVDPERCYKLSVCKGVDKGPEHTVSDWIKKNRLIKDFQEELEYLRKMNYFLYSMKREELESRVRDFFLR
jgi:Fe-S-cluster containining protein